MRSGSRINVRGYRFAVRNFIRRIAYAVNLLHRSREPAEVVDDDLKKLEAEIAAVSTKNDWDTYRKKPGLGTYSLAGFLYILPKIGLIKLVAVKGPTQATETAYVHSVMRLSDELNRALRRFTPPPATVSTANSAVTVDQKSEQPLTSSLPESGATPHPAIDRQHPLANRDLDPENVIKPGGYRLTDDTYAALLQRLTERPVEQYRPAPRRHPAVLR